MKPRHTAALALVELRDKLARTQRNFLETDLSLAAAFADTAKRRYKAGDSDRADRSKHHAEVALKAIRHYVATTELLSAVVLDSFAQRCDELERILMSLDRAK